MRDYIEINGIMLPRRVSFRAPTYSITKRENHGNGYHSHLEILNGGKYDRSGHILTLKDGVIYVESHGRGRKGPLFNIESKRGAVLRDIGHYVGSVFKGIPLEEFLLPSEKAIQLVRIN